MKTKPTGGRIVAVCTSKKKGISKVPVEEAVFEANCGLSGDAHADRNSHRQVSLLATESIEKMVKLGLKVGPGAFAENLTVEGLDLMHMPIGTRMSAGDGVMLELTQIGKVCHTKCAIYKQVGQCVMPEEGIFARVLRGGVVKPGDMIQVISIDEDQSQGGRPDSRVQA